MARLLGQPSLDSLGEKLIHSIHLTGVTKINGRDTYRAHVNNSLCVCGRGVIDQGEITSSDKYFRVGGTVMRGDLALKPAVSKLNGTLRLTESLQL